MSEEFEKDMNKLERSEKWIFAGIGVVAWLACIAFLAPIML